MDAPQPGNLASALRLSERVAWRFNRLRTMSPAEIGHRVVQAATLRAERWGFAKLVVPPPDLDKSARSWIAAGAGFDAGVYVAAAERVVAGRHDVFALRDVDLGSPPEWNRDPRTHIRAPLQFGKQLDYRNPRLVGDIKYLWEPNRHLHLVTLAQAYALTREERFTRTLQRHLESWFTDCPFRMGANWSSSLEPALRLVNWSLAWQLVGGVEAPSFAGSGAHFRARWLESVYQHVEFVRGHFSLHSSANNHLIGEAAGVYLASLAWPHWEAAAEWRETARGILEREALLQNAPDGVNREQAVSYQQFTFDLLLLPLLAARANGEDFSPAYVKRLETMIEYLASIIDVGGNVPMFGDSDDALVVRLDPRPDFCRYRSSLATAAALFGRPEFKAKAGALDDKTRWLIGSAGAEAFERLARSQSTVHPGKPARLPVRREFREGGYYILGDDFETPREVRLVVDAGPVGYQSIAAHGHADALSFTLSVGGREFLVDTGTYAYHTQPTWRAYFRGTGAHNTVRMDGEDQSQPGGKFMWLAKANAACKAFQAGEDLDFFEGWHDGYTRLADPVIHRRRIRIDKRARRIAIEDLLEMEGEHEVELFFHWSERCGMEPVEDGYRAVHDERAVTLHLPELEGAATSLLIANMDPIGGWISRHFDERIPAPTIRWRATIAGSTLLTSIIDY